jgi:hypothetical protein
VGSIGQLQAWVKGKPLAPLGNQPASYGRLEKAILTIGLALRDIHTVAFMEVDESGHLPTHVQGSPFDIKDYEALAGGCRALLK